MAAIKLDQATIEKLRSSTGPVDFVDEHGQFIGRYRQITPNEPLCPWEADFTVHDAERVFRENDGTTIEEFWKELGVK